MRDSVLWRKIARVIILISKQLNISNELALDMFYQSRIYKMLSNSKYGLQTMSDTCIVDEFILELQNRG